MATYIMFGKYSLDSIRQISEKRTEKAKELIRKNGGEIKSGYSPEFIILVSQTQTI